MDLAIKRELEWKEKSLDFEHKHRVVLAEVEKVKRREALLKYQMDQKAEAIAKLTAENIKLKNNIKDLKQVCDEITESSTQLFKEFNQKRQIHQNLSGKISSIDAQKSSLQKELEESKKEIERLKKCKRDMEEALTKQQTDYEATIASDRTLIENLQLELDSELDQKLLLSERIAWFENAIRDRDSHVDKLEKEKQYLSDQLAMIKEEASRHISSLCVLKTENDQLQEELIVNQRLHEMLRERGDLFERQLKRLQKETERSNACYQQTIDQQKKLMVYLVEKLDVEKEKVSRQDWFAFFQLCFISLVNLLHVQGFKKEH